ncbi:proteasome regulatory particle base subunit [Savitreella phatthalungensis]
MRVLNIGTVQYANDYYARTGIEFLTLDEASREAFFANLTQGKYDGIDAINRHLHDQRVGPFDCDVIERLPHSVKIIGNIGAGYDQIDVEACKRRGILVSNTPGAVREPTADTALFLLLAVLRNFDHGMTATRSGQWLDVVPVGRSPSALTIGILGMGSIGRAFALRCQALGSTLQYHNRSPSKDAPDRVEYVSMSELLSTSDIVFVSVPLNGATRHLLGEAEFAQMKKGSYLINTARGPIIDEASMVAALDNGTLRGVGLDVYEDEPRIHPGLINRPSCVLLPHQGTWTSDAMAEMEILSLDNIRALFEGRPQNIVPELRTI